MATYNTATEKELKEENAYRATVMLPELLSGIEDTLKEINTNLRRMNTIESVNSLYRFGKITEEEYIKFMINDMNDLKKSWIEDKD